MSEDKQYKIAYVIGVYKYDEKIAGYKDLKKLADELAKNSSFKQIVLRHVSESNWGIHFTFISNTLDEFSKYKDLIQNNSDLKPYAWDIQHSNFVSDTIKGLKEKISENILVHKPLEIEELVTQ